ncbi:MAG: response regulator transcription factor [Clostridia bacterium]|nr:response regulator transcription factor [Clostridia bacterium]
MKQKILIVDDEVPICDLLKINLESEGYEVTSAHDGREALKKIESFRPDLLILDLMLPEINGFDICRKVTSENPIPIIMLTAKSDIVDKVLGLELGADDYITKPFHTRELVARVKALLRRASHEPKSNPLKCLTNGCLEVYPYNRKAVLSGCELELSVKEYDLLCFLMNNIEQVFSRDHLLERVWGYDFAGDTRTVDVHVQRLRKKMKDEHPGNEFIQTVFGVGYRMKRQIS